MSNLFDNVIQQVKNMQEKMQDKMEQSQELLAKKRLVGESGAGMVKLTIDGNGNALDIEVDDSVYNEDKKVLQGLIIAAVNDSNRKREKLKQEELKKMMSGVGLPDELK